MLWFFALCCSKNFAPVGQWGEGLDAKRIIGGLVVVGLVAAYKLHVLLPFLNDYMKSSSPTEASTPAPTSPARHDLDADRVVQEIIADKAKLQKYCSADAVHKQLQDAEARKDEKRAQELRTSYDALLQTLDPDDVKQVQRFSRAVDNNNADEGLAIANSLAVLDQKCGAS